MCWGHEPHPTQLDVLGQGPTEDGQGLLVVVVTEVVDSLGLDRQRLQFLGHESELGGDRRHRVETLLEHVARTREPTGRRGRRRPDDRSWLLPLARDHGRRNGVHPDLSLLHHPAPPELFTGKAVAAVARAARSRGLRRPRLHRAPHALGPLAERRRPRRCSYPFIALTWAAVATERLRLLTNITVVAYRNPFLLAKTVATLDSLSGRAGDPGGGRRVPEVGVPGPGRGLRRAQRALRRGPGGPGPDLVGRAGHLHRTPLLRRRQPARARARAAAAPHLDRGQQHDRPCRAATHGQGWMPFANPPRHRPGRPDRGPIPRTPTTSPRCSTSSAPTPGGGAGAPRRPLRRPRRRHAGSRRLRRRPPPGIRSRPSTPSGSPRSAPARSATTSRSVLRGIDAYGREVIARA